MKSSVTKRKATHRGGGLNRQSEAQMRKPLLGHDAGDSKDRFPNDTAVSAEVDTIRNRAEAMRGTGQVQPTRFLSLIHI